MSVDVSAIRLAMAEALEPMVAGNASPYVLAQPTPPGVQVLSPRIDYDFANSRGYDEWEFIVQGFVALNGDIGPQMLLDELTSPDGLKAALEADVTLGGLVDSVRVVEQLPPRQVEAVAGHPMLLVEWRVSMIVRGE